MDHSNRLCQFVVAVSAERRQNPLQIVLDLYFFLFDYVIHCVDEYDIQYRKFVPEANSILKRLQLDHADNAKQLFLHWN